MSMRTEIEDALRGNGGMTRQQVHDYLDDGLLNESTFLATLSQMRVKRLVVEDATGIWLAGEHGKPKTVDAPPQKAKPEPLPEEPRQVVEGTKSPPAVIAAIPRLSPPPTAVLQLGPLRVELTGPRNMVQTALCGVTTAMQDCEW